MPVCLSMFSSLLFLRVGYVVGNAGLLVSFAQLVLAYSILVCTIMSISAIATNGSVESGGVYFMISRTLGPQLGGSVGILFYLANVVAGALYASGFSETLAKNFGPDGRITQLDFFDDDYYHSILLGVVSELLSNSTQCENFLIFLSLIFYVKSVLRILEMQNQPF